MRGKSIGWLHAACAAAVLVAAALANAASAEAGAPSCTVLNVSTHRAYSGAGAMQKALAKIPTWRAQTVRVTGVCVGNFTISHRRVTLVGLPSRRALTPTLQGAPGVWGSVLRVTGNSHVVIKDLRITGGRGTPIRLFGPEPLVTPAGGAIFQDGGTLTLRGHTLLDNNSAASDLQAWPGNDLYVRFGAGGAIFARHAFVQVAGETVLRENHSVGGQYIAGGGGGVYVDSGVVVVRDRARITANGSSGAWVAESGTLRVAGHARIDANYGGGDGDPAGGGVLNNGALTVTDTTSIDHNEAFWGGGVYNAGVLTLSGAARIADNNGWMGGGGVDNHGRVALGPGVAITRNQTGSRLGGGGVLNWGAAGFVVGDTSAVYGNIPDDIASAY